MWLINSFISGHDFYGNAANHTLKAAVGFRISKQEEQGGVSLETHEECVRVNRL